MPKPFKVMHHPTQRNTTQIWLCRADRDQCADRGTARSREDAHEAAVQHLNDVHGIDVGGDPE
jgi:hypothetical protein